MSPWNMYWSALEYFKISRTLLLTKVPKLSFLLIQAKAALESLQNWTGVFSNSKASFIDKTKRAEMVQAINYNLGILIDLSEETRELDCISFTDTPNSSFVLKNTTVSYASLLASPNTCNSSRTKFLRRFLGI